MQKWSGFKWRSTEWLNDISCGLLKKLYKKKKRNPGRTLIRSSTKIWCSPEMFRLHTTQSGRYWKNSCLPWSVNTVHLQVCLKAQWALMLLLWECRFPEEDKIHDVMWLDLWRHRGEHYICMLSQTSGALHVLYNVSALSTVHLKALFYLKVNSWPFNH